MVAGWFGTLGAERVAVDFDAVRVVLAQDLASVHAFVTYAGVSAEGRELRAMHNRLTWVLNQKSGAWKIVHEHTSAPVDFATSKVLLQRQ
jgi:ketosteroid isomerase-like protein